MEELFGTSVHDTSEVRGDEDEKGVIHMMYLEQVCDILIC